MWVLKNVYRLIYIFVLVMITVKALTLCSICRIKSHNIIMYMQVIDHSPQQYKVRLHGPSVLTSSLAAPAPESEVHHRA